MIVVVGGIKGGSGKTTIATNLTVMRASEGKKVLLVDADEQKSASSWAQQREIESVDTPWTTIQLAGMAVRTQLQRLINDYDDIIVDVGGRDTTSQRSALTIAHTYIVPFQPRSLDIWTIAGVKTLVYEIASINPALKTYALINRGDSIGVDNQDAYEILSDCEGIQCLGCIIGQRKAFANAATNGLGVVEMKPQDKKAVMEMTQLYQIVFQSK